MPNRLWKCAREAKERPDRGVGDELIALKDGRLLTRGTPDQIMQGDVLKGIFGVEMGVFAHPVTGQPIGYVQ